MRKEGIVWELRPLTPGERWLFLAGVLIVSMIVALIIKWAVDGLVRLVFGDGDDDDISCGA